LRTFLEYLTDIHSYIHSLSNLCWPTRGCSEYRSYADPVTTEMLCGSVSAAETVCYHVTWPIDRLWNKHVFGTKARHFLFAAQINEDYWWVPQLISCPSGLQSPCVPSKILPMLHVLLVFHTVSASVAILVGILWYVKHDLSISISGFCLMHDKSLTTIQNSDPPVSVRLHI